MDDAAKIHIRINDLSDKVVRHDERLTRHREDLQRMEREMEALTNNVKQLSNEMRASSTATSAQLTSLAESISRFRWIAIGMSLVLGASDAASFKAVAELVTVLTAR